MKKFKAKPKTKRTFGKEASPKPLKTPAERKKAFTAHKELRNKNLGVLSKEPGVKTIYVGNLSYAKNPFDIKDMFKTYGEVSYVRLVMDKETKKSRGIAFVQMTEPASLKKAVKELNGAQVDGRSLKVSIAKENGSKAAKSR